MDPTGKAALVTGGARRLGAACVEALAGAGARVAIHCHRSVAAAEALAARCPGSVVLPADLADRAARDRLVPRAAEALGGLDILVNNASTFDPVDVERIDDAAWDAALEVNLTAPFQLARAAGLAMKGGGGGVVVNLLDAMLGRPYPGYLPYFAAKAGLAEMTIGLARALAPAVRVCGIAPGPMVLPENADADRVAAVVRAVPLQRLGGVQPIAEACLFAVRNDFLTAEILRVDGGRGAE